MPKAPNALQHPLRDAGPRTEVPPEAPTMDVIPATLEKRPKRARRHIAQDEARHHKHRMPIAARSEIEERKRPQESSELIKGHDFQIAAEPS
jgi:hypothetical protein